MERTTPLNELDGVLSAYLVPELMEEVRLPGSLLEPTNEDETKDRFYLTYYELFGVLRMKIGKILGHELDSTELDHLSARLKVYMKEQGLAA